MRFTRYYLDITRASVTPLSRLLVALANRLLVSPFFGCVCTLITPGAHLHVHARYLLTVSNALFQFKTVGKTRADVPTDSRERHAEHERLQKEKEERVGARQITEITRNNKRVRSQFRCHFGAPR